MGRIREFHVRSNCAGITLFHFLRRVLPRGYKVDITTLIREGHVELNGKAVPAEKILHIGDCVCIEADALKASSSKRVPDSLQILYQDEQVVCVDKPAGLPVIPDRRPTTKTAIQICREMFNTQDRVPRPVHRLDKWTSGVLVIALDKQAVEPLTNAFAERLVKKTYLALVRGIPFPREGVIDEPIGPNAKRMTRIVVGGNMSKPAVTRYSIRSAWRGFSLLELHPETGRTHQIRVHLAHIGHPVLCDSLYGGGDAFYLSEFKLDYRLRKGKKEQALLTRQALHAAAITFTSPATGKEVTVNSPLPHDLDVVRKKLNQYGETELR